MRRIILDTNFIIDFVKWKIDLIGELKRICDFSFQLFIPDAVMTELNAFPPRSKEGQAYKVAMLVLKNAIVISTRGGLADDVLVRLASKMDIVATQDQALKRRLRASGVGVVVIREKGYLALIDRTLYHPR